MAYTGSGTEADPYLVHNPQELYDCMIQNPVDTDNDRYIKFANDIDCNYNEDWYFRMGKTGFFDINTSSRENTSIVIDGDGHCLANIYLYKDQFLFYNSGNNGWNVKLVLKNITFEIINNDAFFAKGNASSYPWTVDMINCVINIKANISVSAESDLSGKYCAFSFYDSAIAKPRFINCVFNIYAASMNGNNIGMIGIYCDDNSSNYNNKPIFESCEFKIRNNSGYKISIFRKLIVQKQGFFVVDNCAFFYNDLKDISPTTTGSGQLLFAAHYSSIMIDSPMIVSNSYFASFSSSNQNKPYVCVGNGADNFSSSFYDNDRIVCVNRSSQPINTPSKLVPLTTAQCKDRDALSNIGYNFAEEI